MNRQECDILKILIKEPFINQRRLAESSGYSLGTINHYIGSLRKKGYIDQSMKLTSKAKQEFQEKAPQNAIILAAGFGMRMVPINVEMPKGLLEVNGEVLIERIIRQLHEVDVRDIYIVVGFMKEKYEYLIDKFQVELIVNPDYAKKNNMFSLKKASSHLANTYIIPCDIWCRQNPFSYDELYSWYMVSDLLTVESNFRINGKKELVSVASSEHGNTMIGIAYLLQEQSSTVISEMNRLCHDRSYDDAFWETALYQNHKMIVQAKLVRSSDNVEINTYEQLRDLDSNSDQLKADAMLVISNVLGVDFVQITQIETLKKGMTNRSFLFTCNGKKYIMRIPGEGTNCLINRKQESSVYLAISNKGISDNSIYINPENGYKITEFVENSRVCDPKERNDVTKCIKKLRAFHEMNLKVDHDFDLFYHIDFYESLWLEKSSVYKDYEETKKNVFLLEKYINCHVKQRCLTHIDAVPDNFLFAVDEQGNENLYLIDWEYAGMQDPHVDLAMFCIYSFYNRQEVDDLIQIYFDGNCPEDTKIKIYCYISVCGLLWSNWCEYKRQMGVDFGEYSLRQYRYAKDYYRIVCNALGGK